MTKRIALEFEGIVENGVIHLPPDQKNLNAVKARVILLIDETETTGIPGKGAIRALLEHPLKIPGFTPMKRDEIYER
ncbi:MAG TPA: hypothetical protein PKO06_15230 [Candidatus Ozemobacteraceae bacterium]|nr:hypothetical protein [Candidatus Ozemobacteraceae bacterium]